jgi:hypothetical protein
MDVEQDTNAKGNMVGGNSEGDPTRAFDENGMIVNLGVYGPEQAKIVRAYVAMAFFTISFSVSRRLTLASSSLNRSDSHRCRERLYHTPVLAAGSSEGGIPLAGIDPISVCLSSSHYPHF